MLVWPPSFAQQLQCHALQTGWSTVQAYETFKAKSNIKYLTVTVVKFVLPKKLLQNPNALIYWAAICIALFKSPRLCQQQEDFIKGINNVSCFEGDYLPVSGEKQQHTSTWLSDGWREGEMGGMWLCLLFLFSLYHLIPQMMCAVAQLVPSWAWIREYSRLPLKGSRKRLLLLHKYSPKPLLAGG